jgi:hypothetical protein
MSRNNPLENGMKVEAVIRWSYLMAGFSLFWLEPGESCHQITASTFVPVLALSTS